MYVLRTFHWMNGSRLDSLFYTEDILKFPLIDKKQGNKWVGNACNTEAMN